MVQFCGEIAPVVCAVPTKSTSQLVGLLESSLHWIVVVKLLEFCNEPDTIQNIRPTFVLAGTMTLAAPPEQVDGVTGLQMLSGLKTVVEKRVTSLVVSLWLLPLAVTILVIWNTISSEDGFVNVRGT